MFISRIVEIDNYRNLSGMQLSFNKELNFIVGENNIGKTNIIELLDCILSKGKFNEKDFWDIREPIKATVIVEYEENEIGFFENNFDTDDELKITIMAIQNGIDDRIEYCHAESGAYISPRTIKMMNFIYYSSLRSPNKEINFINNVGTGKVLNYLMKKSLESKKIEEMDLLNIEDIKDVVKELNSQIDKLNGLSGEKIEAFISDDKENLINRILEIGDSSGRGLGYLGDGVQYSFNIFLHILELLVHLKSTKKEEEFENLIIITEDDERLLPLMIGLDEPEIHQHPYRQRALIKSIKRIIDNEDEDFKGLVKELFNIDGFIGQIFIVTHSPNILLNDYKQIIRVYKSDEMVEAKCGQDICFEPNVRKHLMRSFVYIKEAMFSKYIILVEGDTEYGAVPVFADRMECDIDGKGIGVIKLDGADSIERCMELYNSFNINSIAIIDKDKKD